MTGARSPAPCWSRPAPRRTGWRARSRALIRLDPGCAPDGRPWPDGAPATVRPSDIAVLCRKRAQFPAIRAALEARGIPVEVVGLGGLLTVPEVADIVATLRVLHDPTASDALARLLVSPRWRIGPADLVALGRRARALASQANADGLRRAGARRARVRQVRVRRAGARRARVRQVRVRRAGARRARVRRAGCGR